MPNLEIPVQAVSKAVSNLVRLVLAPKDRNYCLDIVNLECLISISNVGTFKLEDQCLKGVFAKTERGIGLRRKISAFDHH